MNLPGVDKKLTVCCYVAPHAPRRSLECIDRLLALPSVGKTWDLIFGIDAPSYEVQYLAAEEHRRSKKAVFMESAIARGKAHWQRVMLANIRSEYVLLIDDALTPSPQAIDAIFSYLRENPEVDIAGFKHSLGSPVGTDGERRFPIPKDGPLLIKTAIFREFELLPAEQAQAIAQRLVFFDFSIAAELGVSPDSLGPMMLRQLFLEIPPNARELSVQHSKPLISAAICAYGHHPELILRCVDSIIREPFLGNSVEIILGCNQVSDEVMHELERRMVNHPCGAIVRSPLNFNKSGMQRFMYRMARAPYILSLDDDMYFKGGWLHFLREQILKSHPFEVAGRLHALSNRKWWSGKKKPYDSYCEKKHWWRGKRPFGLEVVFPAGQCFLARTDFLLENNYPDLDMRIDWDDVLLGDMVTQLDGNQIWFEGPLMERVVVDDIPSRGQHGGG